MSSSIRSATGDRAAALASVEAAPQPYAAECLGTFVLVFAGVGASVLAGQYVGALGIALAFGLVVTALVYALGPVSGAHLNPAVTLGMYVAHRMELATAVRYWVAQLVGSVIGGALLLLVAHQVPGLDTHGSFGSNGFGDRSAVRIGLGGAFVLELLLTCVFVYVFLAVTHRATTVASTGIPIGLAYAAVSLVGVPLTGASLNPARSFGPAIFAGGPALGQLWLFLVAPLLGGALAAALHWITHAQVPGAAGGTGLGTGSGVGTGGGHPARRD